MKAISITSIICGTALIMAPLVHDLLSRYMVFCLMEKGNAHVDITGELNDSFGGYCMFIGLCMIVSGLVIGVRSRQAPEAPLVRMAPAPANG